MGASLATISKLFTPKCGSRAALVAALLAAASGAAGARETVPVNDGIEPGTVIVRTSQRRLYFVVEKGRAVAYRVAVGRAGKQWFGRAVIDGKHIKPAWVPPAEIRKDNPKLPDLIPGGSPSNPMGAAALTLAGDKYAIHGTNRPDSIGTAASYGCIRMLNEDVTDLYERVSVGTTVLVER